MSDLVLQLIPTLTISLFVFLLALPICGRKGRGFGYAVLCFIPIAGPFFFFYLLSLTDKQVLDRLAALEGRLNGTGLIA
jgi:hypothetical protein